MKTSLKTFIYDFYYFWKLSFFNVWRSRRRTIITLSAICVGTITMILMNGYIEIIQSGLKSEAIQKQFGNLQIARTGYFDADENSQDLMVDFETANRIQKEILKLDTVDYVNQRLQLTGIIGTGTNSTVFMGIFGNPEAENLMAPTLVDGNLLSQNDPSGIVIGRAMARKLNIKTGDSLVMFVTSGSGSQEAISVRVRGIYEALMKEQEKITVYLPIQAGWDLILDKNIHRLLVFYRTGINEAQIEKTNEDIRNIVKKSGARLETRNWESLAVFFKQIIGLFRGISAVIGFILFIVITFNIQNTMHMSILERYREIGTLRAMGHSRFDIVKSFVSEGFLIGLIGSVLGMLTALGLAAVLNHFKLELPPGPGQDKPTPVMFHITAAIVLNSSMISILVATVSSWSPARRGAKIEIIDSLKLV